MSSLHRNPIIRRCLVALARPVAALLHSVGIMRRQIYVRVDGGLASQMHFYMVGEWMRNHLGVPVEYDLSWYDECGVDLDGRFVRNFDLLRFSPNLAFSRINKPLKLSLYRLLYKHINDYEESPTKWQKLKAPLYMDGYYNDPPGFYEKMREFFSGPPVGIDETDIALAKEIEDAPEAVGMHVRRGDLSVEVFSYGKPAGDDYFFKAVRLVQDMYGDSIPVFIFSDEPEWVRNHLLPLLPKGEYRIMDRNGSDKGYIDLWLLSKCRHFITSKGSFGRYAAMLSSRLGTVTICHTPDSTRWLTHIPDAIPL